MQAEERASRRWIWERALKAFLRQAEARTLESLQEGIGRALLTIALRMRSLMLASKDREKVPGCSRIVTEIVEKLLHLW